MAYFCSTSDLKYVDVSLEPKQQQIQLKFHSVAIISSCGYKFSQSSKKSLLMATIFDIVRRVTAYDHTLYS